MHTVKKNMLVVYSAQQMYELVADVEKYPLFVPYCADTTIIENKFPHVKAKITLAKVGLHKAFTTTNTMYPHNKIVITLNEGPFKYLQGEWLFEDIADCGCQVILNLDFEFNATVFGSMFNTVFQQVSTKLMDAFYRRAEQVYGK